MDNDPAVLALLAAYAQDVEEGAQLMDIDAEEAAQEEDEDDDDENDLEEMPDAYVPPDGDEDENVDDEDPPTLADPELQGPQRMVAVEPRGVRRAREQPDDDAPDPQVAYWQDEDGEGDENMIRLRPVPGHDDADLDDEDDSENMAGCFSEDEDEQEAEGMILPHLGEMDKFTYMREFWRVLCRMGTETTSLIGRVVRDSQKLSSDERYRITVWIKYWTGYMIEFHYHGLGEVVGTPTGPSGAMERMPGTSAIMCEIWRLTLVLNYESMGELRNYRISDSPFLVKWLLDFGGVPLDCPPKQPVQPKPKTSGGTVTQKQKDEYEQACVKYATNLQIFNSKRRISETPVLKMRQSQVRILLQFLTARMKVIPYSDDIRHLFSVLEFKTAMFFCLSMSGSQLDEKDFRADLAKEVEVAEESRRVDFKRARVRDEYAEAVRQAAAEQPDLEPVQEGGRYIANRDFWIYCTSYWYPIKRALYLLDMMPRMNLERADRPESYLPEGAVARMEAWARRAAKNQGDNFQDRVGDAADDAMRYPGDEEWIAYKHPDESTNVDVVLRKLRGVAYYDDFHAQLNLSPEAVMNGVNTNWVSTTFVLLLFDRYMNTYKGVNWRSGYVIENAFLDEEDTHAKWTTTLEPLLVNVFSHYWLMFKGKVLPLNNIYTSLCIWMFMLRKTRTAAELPADCLFDNTYVGDLIDQILLGKEKERYTTQAEEDNTHLENLKRGRTVATTRYAI